MFERFWGVSAMQIAFVKEVPTHSVSEKLISCGSQNAGAKLCGDVNMYIFLVANWNLQREAFFSGNQAQRSHVNVASFGGLSLQFY